jgi:hypothetical protein
MENLGLHPISEMSAITLCRYNRRDMHVYYCITLLKPLPSITEEDALRHEIDHVYNYTYSAMV